MRYTLQELHGDRWLNVNHGDDFEQLDCQAEHRSIVSGAAQVRLVDNQSRKVLSPVGQRKQRA